MTITPNKAMIDALRELRADPRLNDQAIAKRMGINHVTLWRWAKRFGMPPRKNWRRVPPERRT